MRLVLFTPDIDTIICSPVVEIDPSSDPNKMALYQESNSKNCRFLYIRDETVDAARNTVRLFARVLGAKRCAYVIDACCSDMFEACSRSCSDMLLRNDGLNLRLQWSGQCVFATELMGGVCGWDGCKKSINKLSKSTLHIFSSLASSVLPVIVSDPLWTLPTTSDEHSRSRANKGLDPDQSVTMMNGNAILVSLLMGFIRQFTHVLGGESTKLQLPIVLFPLLERASPVGNHSVVQRAAIDSLQEITLSIGYNDISSLLASNFDYLVDAISLRLSKYTKEQAPMERSLAGVVDVILQSIVYHGGPASDISNGNVSMIGHLLDCILKHFDRQRYTTSLNMFDMARVFWSMDAFMGSSIDSYIRKNNATLKTLEEEKTDDDHWFQRLDVELNVESAAYYADEDTDKAFDEEQEITIDDNNCTEATPLLDDQDETDFMQEVSSINSILSRCCYLLCYADLQIQVLCCGTILSGFQSLGKIGSYRIKLRGEAANNPLLPSIAEYWPSIIARLRSASVSLASVNKLSRSDLSIRHMMATDQVQEGPSKASLEVLISKLLLIISELCASSDGFFVDRFEKDVYPIISKLIQDILPRDGFNSSLGLQSPKQKQFLTLPILHCFKSTFESSCRHGLTCLIPSAGTMLFPFLSFEGPIGDESMNALKAMLAVDCDALWRGLHTLSKRTFPDKPIRISGEQAVTTIELRTKGATSVRSRDCNIILLSQRAGELLDFIEELPEQEI